MGRSITSLREVPLPLSLRFRREIHTLSRIKSEEGELRLEEFSGKSGNLFLGDRSLAPVKVTKEGNAFFFPSEGPAEWGSELDELIAATRVSVAVYKGKVGITHNQVRNLTRGSLIGLDVRAEDPSVLFLPELGVRLGRGEVVRVGEKLGLRITEIGLEGEPVSRSHSKPGINRLTIDLYAILGWASITLGEVFTLNEGTILELDSSYRDPVRVMIGEGAMIPARIEAGEREMILRILGDAPAGSIFRRVNTSHEEVALAEASARKDEADLDTSVLSSDVLSMVCIEEPPELGALLLTQLGADRGVAVLSDMGEERGVEILSALSSMDPIQAHPSAFRSLAEVIKRYAPERAKGLRETEGGFDSAEFCVELLNGLEEGRRESLLSRLRDLDSEAAEHILAQLFRFEDIIRLSDRDIQKVLREIDSEELAKALLGVSEEVSEAFLRNMSSRAGKLLREEMDYVGSLPEERSEQSRRKVLELIRILDKQGDIVVPKNTAT